VKTQLVVDGARDSARTEIDPEESANATREHGKRDGGGGTRDAGYATCSTLKTARA
jgi:hypothetical protein